MASVAASTAAAVQHKLWYGRIPVIFTLHASDVTTLHAPRPFYAMLPRMGYLVAHTRNVIEYFQDAAPPVAGLPGNGIWFEHQGRPLKWHLPCGLLFDLSQPPAVHAATTQPHLPWRITVHFSGFPADELLPCEHEQVVEAHFMHTLKQSLFLRTGSTKLIMGMPEAQQTQIWTSVVQNDLGSFSAATRDLQLASSSSSSFSSSPIRLIPVRIYAPDGPVAIQLPVDAASNPRLLDVLCSLLPDLFTPTKEEEEGKNPRREHHGILLHGIPVPAATPLLSLYECFAFADGFLHVAVVALQ